MPLLILFLPRLYRFGVLPESLYWDEVAIGLDSRSIIQTGKDLSQNHWLQPLFYSYGDYKAPVYIWLTTTLGAILGTTEKIVRLPSLLASFGIAIILCQLTALLFPKKPKLPLFVLLNFLLMPWSFHFSRTGMESHLSLFWLGLMVCLQILGLKKQKPFLMIPAALAGSLSIYSYIGARVITIILYLAVFLIFGLKKAKKNSIGFAIGFLILAVSMGILVKSPYYKASQDYRLSNDNLLKTSEHIEKSVLAQKFHDYSFLSRLFHHRYLYWFHFYFQNFFTHFTPDFLFFEGDSNLRHHSGFGGEALLVQGVLLIIGIAPLFCGVINGTATLILVWLLASPLVSSLVNNEAPHASRAIYMVVPLSFFLGLGMENLYQKLKKVRWGKLLLVGFNGLLLVNFAVFLHDYFVHYPTRSKVAWLAPYKKAAQHFKENPPDKKVFITDKWYQPGLYFAFYGDTKASFLQDSAGQYLKQSDNFTFHLPPSCPPDSWCLAPPDWQAETTKIVSKIPGTDKLVVKEKKAI